MARKSIDDQIKAVEDKLNELKKRKDNQSVVKLSKVSKGISEAVSAIESAAKENNTKVAEVIVLIAALKRTGLKIESTSRGRKSKGGTIT